MCKLLTFPHFPNVGKLKKIFKIIFKTIFSFGIGLLYCNKIWLTLTKDILISRGLCLDIPEDGAATGQLVELLPADVERGEDLDVAAKLTHRVHQRHEPLPLGYVLKHESSVLIYRVHSYPGL